MVAVAREDAPIKPRKPSKRQRTLSDVFGSSTSQGSGSISNSQARSDIDEEDEKETHPGVGTCRSPAHRGQRPSVFVRHAEERFSWEDIIGEQPVGIEGGVPVLWRGCSIGCLSFLDQH